MGFVDEGDEKTYANEAGGDFSVPHPFSKGNIPFSEENAPFSRENTL